MKRITSLIIILLIDFRSHSSPTGCQNDEWQCKDGACISESARCDNFPDCMDNSDEENCSLTPVCLEGLESCPQPNGTTVCVEKAVGCSCGPIQEIDNGKIESDTITIGSEAAVVCNAGYDATLLTVKCQVTGLWETASCLPKDCGTPANIAFGKVTLSDIKKTKYGANADVECNVGFETLTPVIKCDETGSWGTAVCTAKDCGPVAKISFGKVILSDIDNTTYGAKADVVCDAGFDTITPVIKCDEKGSWGTAVCTAKDCGAPSKITFGKVTLSDINNTTYGANADVECDVGFETITPVIKCDETGSWGTAVCTSKDCGAPGNIAYGKVVLSDINNTTYGANADVECNVGFETLSPVIKCDETGSWGTAVCTAKDCGAPSKITFGKVTLIDINNTTYGANADVECDVGFETITPVIKCDETGSWGTAVCTSKDCGAPGNIAYGKVVLSDINNTTYGANADVECNVGFETLSPVIKCDETGSWGTAVCTAKDCGPVAKIAFGKVILSDIDDTTYGATADVECDVGFETLTPVIKCDEKGSWETAVCTAKDCGPVAKISFGKVILSDIDNTTYGAKADVVCDVGFDTITPVIKCDEKGSWGTAVCTAKDCGSTPSISFGKITLSDDTNSTFGATATVTCNTGYLENKQNIICQSSGVWEDAACLPRDCGPVQSIAFGTIVLADSNNTTFGASALVTCDAGYESKTTEVLCLKTGLWEKAECTIRGCGLVPEISHGTIKAPANDSVGSNASVVCDKGYEANVSSVFCKISGQWESASCTIKDCGPVTKIVFGKVTLSDINNTTYGANADVVCGVGFETVTPVIKCDETGSWETAVCTAKDCGSTPSISFGKITLSDETNSTFGATATVTCNTGYLENKQSIICQSSGVWEDAACLPRDCGPVQSIAFGTIVLADSNNTTFGASALVTCDAGYESKTTEVLCLKTGLWEKAECTIRGCGLVPEISHGTIKAPANDSVGSNASVVCDKGYEANVSSVFCKISGQWESASCTIKDCGPVTKIAFGKVTLSDINNTTYGANADVLCDVGFETVTPVIKCDETGRWETAVCTAKDCGSTPSISFGRITLSDDTNSTFGATATVTCNTGYLENKQNIICQSSGVWEDATCLPRDCGPVQSIAFGTIVLADSNNTTFGASALVTCDAGYESKTTEVICLKTGLWERAECTIRGCGFVPEISHGTIKTPANDYVGSYASVVCDTGYEANVSSVFCKISGQWESSSCTIKDCGPVTKIAFGKVTLSDINNTTYGANADVECDVGFETVTPVIKCDETGSWETAVCTAKDCGSTLSISFGKITLSDETNSTFGATATVTCNTGYLENKQNIICQSSGVWEDAACLPRDCGPVQSIAFGTIVLADSNNTTFGASALVTCDAGYESKTTEVFCLKTGLWERAECTVRGCGLVPEISHGTIKTPANDSVGSYASVVCDKGYEANVSSVFCKISGQWESASCTIKDCGHTPAIPFGQITPNNRNITTYGASANVTCYTGYTSNVSKVYCLSTGVWERSACKPIDCGPPPLIKHGNTFIGNYKTTYGATAFVFCMFRYVATRSVIKCQSSGTWENAACVFKGCGSLPEISHGTIKAPANVSIGSFANVTCDTGYEANVSSVMCKWSGLWEAASCKAKDCGRTPWIPFGQSRLINYRNTSYGASARVTCYGGYESNVSTILCQSTGVWQTAVCRPKGCGPVPTILHGRIISTGNTSVGSTAIVTCDVGYTANVSSVMCKNSGLWEQANCSATNSGSLRCYKCSMECSNDVCNERTVVCPRHKQSCQAIIQWNHGYYTLKKGCKRPSANTANGRSKCRRIGYKIVCSYECNGNLCNWELPEIHSYG